MRNKVNFLISLVLVSILLTACSGGSIGQVAAPLGQSKEALAFAGQSDSQQPHTLSVSGSGKAYLTPDIVYVNIGVHTEGNVASEAVTENNTKSTQVVEAIKSFGVEAKDIQTTNFSIYPQPQYDFEGKPTGEIRYSVDNTVYVTLRDLDKIGDLLDAVVKAGANAINGIQFDVADKAKALSEARKDAVANAQSVAQELAGAAGVTLGDVMNISVYGGSSPMPMYEAKVMDSMAAGAASVPVSAGQLLITVEVSIVYEIH